jgi:hypothetical protein
MKVVEFPASENMTVTQALDSAKQKNLKEVLILGFDEEGNEIVRSSKMTRAEALFIIEKTKLDILRA